MVLFSCSFMSNSLQPHGLQPTRLPCPSLSPTVCSDSCPLSQWCHSTMSFSVTLFSSCPQSFPPSGSFPVGRLFGQSFGTSVSASDLPMNIHGWFPLGLTGFISLPSKGISRIFSSTTAGKHQFFGTQPSLWPNSQGQDGEYIFYHILVNFCGCVCIVKMFKWLLSVQYCINN